MFISLNSSVRSRNMMDLFTGISCAVFRDGWYCPRICVECIAVISIAFRFYEQKA